MGPNPASETDPFLSMVSLCGPRLANLDHLRCVFDLYPAGVHPRGDNPMEEWESCVLIPPGLVMAERGSAAPGRHLSGFEEKTQV